MKHLPLKDLIYTCLFFVITFYGSWSIFAEIIRTILPCGVILTLILISAGYFLRIPFPSPESVDAVLGKDPLLVENGENVYVMRTVAHRGAGLDAPENSLAAFKMCSEKGCDVIEFDVILTKDDVPVVYHDNNLERVTDLKKNISDSLWADLSNIDISVKHIFKDRFNQTNIPTLEQTVTQLLASGQRMIIDLKENNMKIVKVIHDLYQRYPDLYTKAVVSSFYPQVLYFVRKGDPKIITSVAWRPNVFAYESYNYPTGPGPRRTNIWYKHFFLELCDVLNEWLYHRMTYFLIGASVILLHKDVVDGRTVRDWRNRGMRVIVWTVNTPAEKQYLARVLKVTYLTDTLTGEGTTHSPPS